MCEFNIAVTYLMKLKDRVDGPLVQLAFCVY